MSKPPASKPPAKKPGPDKPSLFQRLTSGLFVPAKSPEKAGAPARSRDPRIELARLIKNIRARMDPNLLRIAEKLARKGPPTTDQERAMLSVELFLAQRQDDGRFAEKLRERLQREKGTRH